MTISEDEARRLLEKRRRRQLRAWWLGQLDERELLDTRRPEWEELSVDQRLAELADRLGERAVAELREIVAAIRRLDAGRWGVCQACGDPIAEGRLRVLPEARCCAECTPERGVAAESATIALDDERFATDIAEALRSFDPEIWGVCRRCGELLDSPEHDYCDECEGLVGEPPGQTAQPPQA